MPDVASPLVTTAARIDELVEAIRETHVVALDTEADTFHHYAERVCLFQLAFPVNGHRREALVDPFAVDVEPLVSELARRTLVLHGGDYDLRLLGLRYGFRAGEIFDTMVAARYLGEPEVGLAALLGRELGVDVDKGLQRADWSRRPLTRAMIGYALVDVRYLLELKERLSARLEAAGRLDWHRQACRRLVQARPLPRTIDAERSWRVKGSAQLGRRELACLREAWFWREETAAHRDVPPFRVMANEALVRLARQAAGEGITPALERVGRSRSENEKSELRVALERAMRASEGELPPRRLAAPNPPPPLDASQNRRLASLKERRDRSAAELGLEPSLVAPRAALEQIARAGEAETNELAAATDLLPWQIEQLVKEPSIA